MRDLLLWRRLATTPGAEELPADEPPTDVLLRELAAQPLSVRAPYFGRIVRWLEAAEPSARAAALGCLRGATGVRAFRILTAGLDDEDAEVRRVAVETLATSAAQQPARWAHAVFHPRTDVRATVLEVGGPQSVEWFASFLRADPDPDNAARARRAPWPKNGLSLALDMHGRGFATAEECAKLIGATSTNALRSFLRASIRRTPDQTRPVMTAADRMERPEVPVGHDILDQMLAIAGAAEESARAMARSLGAAVLGHHDRLLRQRFVAAATGGLLMGSLPLGWAEIVGAACPAMLTVGALPRAIRRAGVDGLGEYRSNIGRVDIVTLDRLLDGDLTRTPDGALDLVAIARFASLRSERRVRSVTDRFGQRPVLDAAIDDPVGFQAMCEAPEGLAEWVLKSARRFRADHLPGLRAIALATWAGESSTKRLDELLADIAPKTAGEVAVALATLTETGAITVPGKTVERLAPQLTSRLIPTTLLPTLEGLVAVAADPPGDTALTLMVQVARRPADARLAAGIKTWDVARLQRLIALADGFRVLRHDKEQVVAKALSDHADETIRTWARRVAAEAAVTEAAAGRATGSRRVLSAAEREAIELCPAEELRNALEPALAAPAIGVAQALAARAGAPAPNVWACVALIGSADPLVDVAAQLDRYHHDDSDFIEAVRRGVVSNWEGNLEIGPLGHAWLHRWEGHAFALLRWLDEHDLGIPGWLAASLSFRGELGRAVWWEGIASVVVLRSYRMPSKLVEQSTDVWVDLLIAQLDTELGVCAARMLVAMSRVGALAGTFAKLPARLREIAPDTDAATRNQLSRLTRLDGLPARTTAARRIVVEETEDELARIRASDDLDLLERACASGSPRLVHEAALRLIELGAPGQARLARLLQRRPRVRSLRTLIESIPLWSDEDALAVARRCFDAEDAMPVERFRIALSFAERGEPGWTDRAIETVAAPADHVWFMREDWIALVGRVGQLRPLALRLATCEQPHAYRPAAAWLLEQDALDPELLTAVRGFLDMGTDRPSNMRHHAARRLHELGDAYALPLAVAAAMEPIEAEPRWLYGGAGRREAEAIAELLVDATELAGAKAWPEKRVVELLRMPGLDALVRRRALRRMLLDATHPGVRQTVVQLLGPSLERDIKLLRVADIFAWGIRRGRELTGRVFRVHMTTKRTDLGYTRFSANRVFVSPLPVLVGDRHGRDVVEALILHELGHHMYHAKEEDAKVWQQAQTDGLHSLLNLVADEHLERNLRAMESSYGDRLKRLAAYAFQHSEREIPVVHLLVMLGADACPVLCSRPLGVAYDPKSVVVQRGYLLRELERVGQPFARFVRALRMGLGDRHGDPTLRVALDLFKGKFRHLDMAGLYEVTKRLAELYGGTAALAEQFGGHEGLEWDEREGAIHGDGIDDDDVQREVERILDPRQLESGKGRDGPPGKLAINVVADPRFDPITHVERVPVDRDAHRQVAHEVRRAADRLREYLQHLGLAMVPVRARLRGRAFDRTRTQAVVIRRDPRMLVAREVRNETDLFIGIVIDCSGSMQVGTSMQKAHRFGVLIAEAVKSLPGVDARFFGFTDSTIYDAGDARHCAVTSLRPGGGNNDAAALLHVSKVAAASRRKARLLVMISDGLPTECSVDALRGLVRDLTRRRGMCCAQVAVRPLAEVCFPHHVVLFKEDIETSTRRFGEIVSRLVRRAMGR